jgi:hypothetical protein
MLKSTTISIRNAISSLAGFTNKGEPLHWPSGALSLANGRWGPGVLRHIWTSGHYFDEALWLLCDAIQARLPAAWLYELSFGSAGAFPKAGGKDKEDQDAGADLLPIKKFERHDDSSRANDRNFYRQTH